MKINLILTSLLCCIAGCVSSHSFRAGTVVNNSIESNNKPVFIYNKLVDPGTGAVMCVVPNTPPYQKEMPQTLQLHGRKLSLVSCARAGFVWGAWIVWGRRER